MPTERAPTPMSNTTVSLGNSDDRNSERSDSIATVEIISEPVTRTPSDTSENSECENVSRHRIPNEEGGDSQKFASSNIPEIPLERKKSNGISKGVILNAMNFGSYDLKCSPDDIKDKTVVLKDQQVCENGALTPKALEASSESNLKSVENEKEEEKKEMSLPRKIAFGFSFLPSVMFVLTFAVILPCEEYKYAGQCVKNKWSLLLNNTEISSDFSLPETLLLGYQFANSTASFNGLVNLNAENGKEIWKLPLDSLPKHLECLNVDVNEDGIEDCLTILENGDVSAFNLSDGYVFWTFRSNQEGPSILLSGCPLHDGVKPIAVASYSKEDNLGLDVLSGSNGSRLASKEVKLNDRCITFSMKSWKHDNEIDLIFFCKDVQNRGNVTISLVRQSLWCPPGEEGSIIVPQPLIMSFGENENEVMYLPTNEGVLIWTDTEITFVESDSRERWQLSTRYIPQNRIAEFGSFYIGGEQVVLIGQNASSGIVVTVLTSENGKELITLSVPDRTINQAVVLRGNETDTLLLSVLKVKVTETQQVSDNDVVLVSNVTSSPEFRTDVPYKVNGKRSIVEELILLEFEGKNTTHVVLESEIPTSCENGGVCESEYQASHIISAFSEEKENSVNLKIVTLKSPDNNPKQNGSQPFSQLTALDITHEDNQITGVTSCAL